MKINEYNKKKIGLALGGGSALGLAHIGVLRALKENNIKIDYISGTSIGSIIAVLYAFGVDIEDIEREAEKASFFNVIKLHPSLFGAFSNSNIKSILKKYIGESDLSEAKIPLGVMTADVGTGEKFVFKSGNAVKAVLASACLPGIFPPVEIDGHMLIDGGMIENVPISILEDFGANLIIGVNLLKYRKYSKPKNIVGVLMNSFDMIINHKISIQPKDGNAHILIEPDLSEFYMGDFGKDKIMAEIGYNEASKFIPEIKKFQENSKLSFLKKFMRQFTD